MILFLNYLRINTGNISITGKRGVPGGPGPIGPPGYCQFCDALKQQVNRGSTKKG